MNEILTTINDILWSMPLVILVLGAGLYFSIRMAFPQFRYLKEMIRNMGKGEESSKGLSPFRAFIFTAARTVGVGNIAGMATAIFFGGPGAVFWFWILALIGSAVALIEAVLSQTYRQTIHGEYRGGPAYYMEHGMKNKALGKLMASVFAVLTILCFVLLSPTTQSYNITQGISAAFHLPVVGVGIVFTGFLAFVILGGLKRIGSAAQKISPVMALLYILMALIIIVMNITKLPGIFALIFKSAFGTDQVFSAIVGSAISWGIKRGVFANEVGVGSSAVTAAVGEVSHPVKQGLSNALSVFIGTFFVCTTSAIMMLMTGCYNVSDGAGGFLYEGLPGVAYGNDFVSSAIDTVIPGFGAPFVAIAILCFASVALLAYYLYGESSLYYLFPKNKILPWVLKICFLVTVFLGCLLSADAVWTMGDIGHGVMAWVNIISLLILGSQAVRIFKDYDKQRKNGVEEPVFDPDALGITEVSETWKK
ncbi:MAG: alanine/glycine:cation symporter family protein [Eubacteriales bacterium]|nr:alanine/glycine:cation symporter family protein [Eubacteriales bacterium]